MCWRAAAASSPGDGSGIQGGVLSANWELDLWGRVRYGRAASVAQAMSAEADYEYARQSIAAQVAKSWFMATEAGLQIASGSRDHPRQRAAGAPGGRSDADRGGQPGGCLYVARATIGTYQDAMRQLELGREQAIRSLEILLGRYPAAAAAGHAPVTRVPR